MSPQPDVQSCEMSVLAHFWRFPHRLVAHQQLLYLPKQVQQGRPVPTRASASG